MRSRGVSGRKVGYRQYFLPVYQHDAHAWNEVCLESQGWVRVDSTAIVAVARIEQGVSAGPYVCWLKGVGSPVLSIF